MEIILPATLIGVIMALVQVIKIATNIPQRYLPLMSTVFGMVLSLLFYHSEGVLEAIAIGLTVGLAASGTYDFTKKTLIGR